jgi:chaperonin GroEL (HSP60 family)
MIINATKNHVKTSGDGGKTFILIVAHIFKEIEFGGQTVMHQFGRQALISGLNKLKGEIPQLVGDLVAFSSSFDLHCATITDMKEEIDGLISTQLGASFPLVTAQHLSDVLSTFLFHRLTNVNDVPGIILDAITNFDTCYLEAVGHSPCSSQVIEGFVIQRDFFTLVPSLSSATNIKFVLFNCSLDGESSENPAIFSANNELSLQMALLHKTKITNGVIERLKKDGVVLIISSVKMSNGESLTCHGAGISTVHMVEDEEMARLSMLFGIQPVNSLHQYLTELSSPVGEVLKCGYVVLSGHRYVHLIPDSASIYVNIQRRSVVVKQILISGHSKGVCCQIRTAFRNCLKCIHQWLTTDVGHITNDKMLCTTKKATSIPCGGTFELYMYMQLKSKAILCRDPDYAWACNSIAGALLQIPVKLLKNSYHPKAETLNAYHILEKLQGRNPCEMVLNARSGKIVMASNCPHREPLISKVTMLYNILDLIIQILRIDKLVPVTAMPEEEQDPDCSD